MIEFFYHFFYFIFFKVEKLFVYTKNIITQKMLKEMVVQIFFLILTEKIINQQVK